MNFSRYLARKLEHQPGSAFFRLVTRIAIGSIALGLGVMIIAQAIFEGFQEEIRAKIISISGHIQVTKYDLSGSQELLPISTNTPLYQQPDSFSHVVRVQGYSRKAALFYTGKEVGGVMLKGLTARYDSVQLQRHLIAGRYLRFDTAQRYGREALISRRAAERLQVTLGDKVSVMFVQDPPRYNRLEVVGIYETGIEQFDELMVFTDNRLIQYLNNWADTLVGGYEVMLDDFQHLPNTVSELDDRLPYNLWAMPVTEQYREFFDWFVMLERNVLVLMIVILVVVLFNIVAVVLILITERTEMIGMLKALGATNWQIQQLFFYKAIQLIGKGVLWGNVLGLGFCALEYYFRFIPLDPANYYMEAVPIGWNIGAILGFNLLIISLILLIIFLPVQAIVRIRPAAAIRFD